MIQGNPLLATLDATGTVRTMELVAGAFSQIASQGGFASTAYGPPTPIIGWSNDQVLVIHQTGPNRYFTLYDVLMTQLANINQASNGSTQQWRVGYSSVSRMALILDRTGDSTSPRKVRVVTGNLIQEVHTEPPEVANLADVAISPDGSKIAGLTSTQIANLLNPGVNQNIQWPNSFPDAASIGRWEKYSKYLVAGVKGGTTVGVYRFEPNDTLTRTVQMNNAGKELNAIAMSDVGNLLAIGWTDGSDYETIIYRRLGSFYQAIQTLPDIGGLLDFTADGTILVDCGLKKAYQRNPLTGQYDSADSIVASVAPGIVYQAMSLHAPVIVSTVDYYQAGLDLVTNTPSGIVPSDLKITLATSAAPAYDPDHATLADVLGAAEVTSGGWPAGGIPLVNPSRVSDNLSVDYLSDDLEKIIIGSSITFRYVILHQDNIPILRHDLNQNMSVAQNDKLVLDVPDLGILNVSA